MDQENELLAEFKQFCSQQAATAPPLPGQPPEGSLLETTKSGTGTVAMSMANMPPEQQLAQNLEGMKKTGEDSAAPDEHNAPDSSSDSTSNTNNFSEEIMASPRELGVHSPKGVISPDQKKSVLQGLEDESPSDSPCLEEAKLKPEDEDMEDLQEPAKEEEHHGLEKGREIVIPPYQPKASLPAKPEATELPTADAQMEQESEQESKSEARPENLQKAGKSEEDDLDGEDLTFKPLVSKRDEDPAKKKSGTSDSEDSATDSDRGDSRDSVEEKDQKKEVDPAIEGKPASLKEAVTKKAEESSSSSSDYDGSSDSEKGDDTSSVSNDSDQEKGPTSSSEKAAAKRDALTSAQETKLSDDIQALMDQEIDDDIMLPDRPGFQGDEFELEEDEDESGMSLYLSSQLMKQRKRSLGLDDEEDEFDEEEDFCNDSDEDLMGPSQFLLDDEPDLMMKRYLQGAARRKQKLAPVKKKELVPHPTKENLAEIITAMESLVRVPARKINLMTKIKENKFRYIVDLARVYELLDERHKEEALEKIEEDQQQESPKPALSTNQERLKKFARIIEIILCLCDHQLIEKMVSRDFYQVTFGALQHHPALKGKPNCLEFIQGSNLKMVVEFSNTQLEHKIEATYRILYLKELSLSFSGVPQFQGFLHNYAPQLNIDILKQVIADGGIWKQLKEHVSVEKDDMITAALSIQFVYDLVQMLKQLNTPQPGPPSQLPMMMLPIVENFFRVCVQDFQFLKVTRQLLLRDSKVTAKVDLFRNELSGNENKALIKQVEHIFNNEDVAERLSMEDSKTWDLEMTHWRFKDKKLYHIMCAQLLDILGILVTVYQNKLASEIMDDDRLMNLLSQHLYFSDNEPLTQQIIDMIKTINEANPASNVGNRLEEVLTLTTFPLLEVVLNENCSLLSKEASLERVWMVFDLAQLLCNPPMLQPTPNPTPRRASFILLLYFLKQSKMISLAIREAKRKENPSMLRLMALKFLKSMLFLPEVSEVLSKLIEADFFEGMVDIIEEFQASKTITLVHSVAYELLNTYCRLIKQNEGTALISQMVLFSRDRLAPSHSKLRVLFDRTTDQVVTANKPLSLAQQVIQARAVAAPRQLASKTSTQANSKSKEPPKKPLLPSVKSNAQKFMRSQQNLQTRTAGAYMSLMQILQEECLSESEYNRVRARLPVETSVMKTSTAKGDLLKHHFDGKREEIMADNKSREIYRSFKFKDQGGSSPPKTSSSFAKKRELKATEKKPVWTDSEGEDEEPEPKRQKRMESAPELPMPSESKIDSYFAPKKVAPANSGTAGNDLLDKIRLAGELLKKQGLEGKEEKAGQKSELLFDKNDILSEVSTQMSRCSDPTAPLETKQDPSPPVDPTSDTPILQEAATAQVVVSGQVISPQQLQEHLASE